MALRDQLKTADDLEGTGDARALRPRSPRHRRRRPRRPVAGIGGVPAGLPPEVQDETPENQLRFVHHIARYGAPDQIGRLDRAGPQAERHGHHVQAELDQGDASGFQERGHGPGAAMHETRRRACPIAAGLEATPGVEPGDRAGQRAPSQRSPGDSSEHRGRDTRRLGATLLRADGPDGDRPARATVRCRRTCCGTPPRRSRLREIGRRARSRRAVARSRRDLLVEIVSLCAGPLQAAIAVGLARRRAAPRRSWMRSRPARLRRGCSRISALPSRSSRRSPGGCRSGSRSLLAGLPPADQKLGALIDRRRAGFRTASHSPNPGHPGLREDTAGSATSSAARARGSGRSSTASAAAALDRLVEDILDPNRNVDQAFRTTILALENGQVVSGLLLREEGEVLVLADAQGKEVRVPRLTVQERQTSQLSPMPANLVDQIPEEDFYRLIAYLLSNARAGQSTARVGRDEMNRGRSADRQTTLH